MSTQRFSDPLAPTGADLADLRRSWAWFLILGMLMMIGGAVCISAPWWGTAFVMFVFAWSLIVAAVLQFLNAFLGRNWRGFFLHVLAGIFQLFIGVAILEHPTLTALTVTLLLAIMFLAGGAARIIFTLFEKFPGRGWVLINGFITFLLGVLIWRHWPSDATWVMGMFLGIDLIFNGWAWVMLGIMAKNPPAAAA